MNFLDIYEIQGDEHIEIEYENGNICIVKDYFETIKSTKIASIEVSLEYPENMLGIMRILNVKIIDELDNNIHEENDLIDNSEFYDNKSVQEFVADFCNVDVNVVVIV